MVLKSRKAYENSEAFRDAFLASVTPGIIERSNFIKWQSIFLKNEKYKHFFDFFKQINLGNKERGIQQLADAFMSADSSMDYIKTAFELIGHTGDNYVSNIDYLDFKAFSESKKTQDEMFYISNILYDLGLFNVLDFDLENYFTGVQVGLETHRRKNIGGETFSFIMKCELERSVKELESHGLNVELHKEMKIVYKDGITSKTVDYCLVSSGKKIGLEVNFYTSSGSKPTEIKRSYGQVNYELEKVSTMLVWVTDGIGYEKMKNSLKEARDIHKNIYNLKMFQEHFSNDAYLYFSGQ